MSKSKAPECIRYAGALGHTWIVTSKHAEEAERVRCECNDGPYAARVAGEAEEQEGVSARIWHREWRHRGRRWIEVSRSAAMIASD
jgi:hypothetical protein